MGSTAAPRCHVEDHLIDILKAAFGIQAMSHGRTLQVCVDSHLVSKLDTPFDKDSARSSSLMVRIGLQQVQPCKVSTSVLRAKWKGLAYKHVESSPYDVGASHP